MIIEASHLGDHGINSEIDIIVENIDFLANKEPQTINESGINGIGQFNFSYHMQHLDNKCTNKCIADLLAKNGADQSTSSTPTDTSFIPADGKQGLSSPAGTSVVAANNGTGQQTTRSSSSSRTWIAVAILFILLTILFFIISIVLMWIVRTMSMEPKEMKKESSCINYGE